MGGKLVPRCLTGFAAVLVGATSAIQAGPATKTTITTYDYNADGAMTAVTVQVHDESPVKTYLTWDHFTPDVDDPTAGTVSAGDGRLVGVGPVPGTGGATSTFQFDPRDRLTSYGGDSGSIAYDYHANGMMKSSSAAGDDLLFYYDAGRHPSVTNVHQSGPDWWSAYLGAARFLDDGSEEVVLAPRKDNACSYNPSDETVQSYVYDAFGATDAELAQSYDLRDNPFRFAKEYRDPIWGGYFLRGRWYHPDLPSFLSRDPAMHLNRYAYGAGNPVMNTDPSGYSAKWYGGVEHFMRGLDHALNKGVGGHFARFFLSPLMGPIQILAYPDQFWHAVKTDQGGIDVFLALGVASEVAGGLADSYLAGISMSLGRRFLARTASDLTIGAASSIAASVHRGSHFDWKTFGQGLELSFGAVATRGLTGFNVRSGFQLTGSDVADLTEYLKEAPENTALVFRMKSEIPSSVVGGKSLSLSTESPFQQALHLGTYHERLIAITKDEFLQNDAIVDGIRLSATEFDDFASIQKQVRNLKGKFEFVGRVHDFDTSVNGRAAFLSNPHNALIFQNDTEIASNAVRVRTYKVNEYGQLTNNCQHHAYAVLKEMSLR